MDLRLKTVESIVGCPIECGGLFTLYRGGFAPPKVAFGLVGSIELAVGAIRYRWRNRPQPKWPRYFVLALADDTLFVFAAAIPADAVGAELARFARTDIHAERMGSFSMQLTIASQGLSLALVDDSLDHASFQLVEQLTQPSDASD